MTFFSKTSDILISDYVVQNLKCRKKCLNLLKKFKYKILKLICILKPSGGRYNTSNRQHII